MTDSTETDVALREEFTRNMMSNLDGDLDEQITKLRAANAALKQMVSDKDGLLTALRAECDAAREAVHIFLPPGSETMEAIIWDEQPDEALMTIRIRYGQFKRARALLATEPGGELA